MRDFTEHNASGLKATMLAAAVCLTLIAPSAMSYPDPYHAENFDTWPQQTIWGEYSFNGWSVSNSVVRPYSGFGWPNNANSNPHEAGLRGNAAAERSHVLSPLMTNGAGRVSLYYAFSQLGNATFELQYSTNGGSSWITHASVTDTNVDDSAYKFFASSLDIYEDVQVRIEKTADSSSTLHLLIDDVVVDLPPAYAVISDVQSSPTPKLTDTPVLVSAKIVPQVYGSNLVATVVYSTNNWATSAGASMTATGNQYWVTGSGIPAMDKPGLTVEYYIDVELDGPTTNNTHSYWPAGAPSTTDSYMLRARPFYASYSNMTVTGGPPTTAMLLQSDYVWRGVTATGNYVNPSFNFQAGATTWGDTNQSETTLPVSGLAETSGTIDLTETINGHMEFTFNETATNSQYGIQPCEYVYFDDWSGATVFSSYTNSEQWSMYNARTTTGAETNKAFTGEGLSCVLRGASNGYLRTPFLPNGLGSINFRMRNWQDDGSIPVKFAIEKSLTGASWVPVTSFDAILSADYLFFSINIADDANRYIRIINGSSNITDYICVDNVSATPPGALVNLLNPTIDPAAPDASPMPVNVTIDYIATGGATNLEGRVYWLAPDSVDYDWAPMTSTGTTFYGQIPPSLAGTVYYYFECLYDGFNAAPAQYPNGGPASPLSFVASSNAPAYRVQDFDSWPQQTIWGDHTFSGWTVSNGVIRQFSGFGWPNNPNSVPHAAGLNGNAGVQRSAVISPNLTNGVGNVSFYYAFSQLGTVTFELQSSTNGGASWTTHTSVTDTDVDDNSYKQFSYDVDIGDDVLIRIEKTADTSSTLYLLLDDIICAPPSADAVITNVFLSPGYPGTADTVTVSCDVYTASPLFRSFDFRPKLCYRVSQGTWTTNTMTKTNTNTWQATIPPQVPDTVEYFFRVDFAGYYYTNGSISTMRSPAFLPDGSHTQDMPDTYFEYVPRRFLSEYDSVSVSSTVGTASMSLVGDTTWQGVFEAPGTTQMVFNFEATGYFTGSGIDTSTNSYGDGAQVFTDPPFSGFATEGGPAVTVNIDTSSMSQVVFFFNPSTGYYEVRRGAYEDFDEWLADPNFFANSLNLADILIITNRFDNWPINFDYVTPTNVDQANFQGGDWLSTYPTFTPGPHRASEVNADDGYYVENFRIVPEYDGNNSVEFDPDVSGALWQSDATRTDGLKQLDWGVRCYFPEHYHTWYTNGLNWSNYYATLNVYATDESAAYPTVSLLAYYQNETNYYECFLTQTNFIGTTARGRFGIRSVINGVAQERQAGEWSNLRISVPVTMTFGVCRRDNLNEVELYCHLSKDNRDRDVRHVSTNLIGGGSIGLRVTESAIVAQDVEVHTGALRMFSDFGEGTFTTFSSAGWDYNDCKRRDDSCYLSNAIGTSITSPTLGFTPDEVRFRCHRGSGSNNPSFNLEGFDGSWDVITNFTWSGSDGSWKYFKVTSGLAPYSRFRVSNANGFRQVRFHHIWITETALSEDFSDGIANDWEAPYGYWYVDAPSQTYRRQAYCGPTATYELWRSDSNDAPYPINAYFYYVGSYTVSNHQWQTVSREFKHWGKMFTRLRHINDITDVRVRFDDVTQTSWRAKNYEVESNGWAMTEGWVTEQSPGERQVELWRSRADPDSDQTIRSEKMTNGVGIVEFDYEFADMGGSNATFNLEYDYLTNGSWPVIQSYTVTPAAPTGKFYLNISTSEQWFVRVRHTTTNFSAQMKIDNFKITDYRPRDDRTWEAYNAKITSLEDVREFEPAYQPEDDVRTAYLNFSPTNDTLNNAIYSNSFPYIQSAKVNEGIGRVSFWYRAWENDGDPPGKIILYASASETAPMSNWTQLAAFNVDNSYYKLYQNDFYVKDKYYLRLTADTNGFGRIAIDNMLVAQPLAADFDVSLIQINPNVPLSTDTVNVAAELNRFVLAPSNIQATVYYHVGTNDWGNLSETWDTNNNKLAMTMTASSPTNMRFESLSAIPAQGIDTVVQYYVEFTFDGVFSSVTSPKKGRTFTNPSWYSNINLNVGAPITNPYYIVYSCPTSHVWINEFNYGNIWNTGVTNEFVEIAGQANSHVRNWYVELLREDHSVYGSYPITNITTIPNDTGDGFGFWTLGDAELGPEADVNYTNVPTGDRHMRSPKGGIRLVRASGIWEHFVSYGGTPMTGAVYTADDTAFGFDGTIRLVGTGEVANAFTWQYQQTVYATHNAANVDQTLVMAVPPPPTYSIMVSNFWTTSSNTWIVSVSDHSNRIEITPWYCTNLVETNWIEVTGFSETYTAASGTYTQWFDNVTNSTPVFFKISSTNDP